MDPFARHVYISAPVYEDGAGNGKIKLTYPEINFIRTMIANRLDRPKEFMDVLLGNGWGGQHTASYSSPDGIEEITVQICQLAIDMGPKTLAAVLKNGLDIGYLTKEGKNKPHPDAMSAKWGVTELHSVASQCQAEMLELLLKYGADPNLICAEETPLLKVLNSSFLNRVPLCVTILLSHGADPNLATESPAARFNFLTAMPPLETVPLLRAIERDDWTTVRLLLSRGADPNLVSTRAWHRTALFYVSTPAQASLLLRHGADIHYGDNHRRTALHNLAVNGTDSTKPALMRTLLEAGADPNAHDKEGLTPLALLTAHGWDESCLEVMLQNTAKPGNLEAGDNRGRTVLFCARGYPERVTSLITHGANPFAVDDCRRTLLHDFVLMRKHDKYLQDFPKCSKGISSLGIDVNAKDMFGWTALHYAVFLGHKRATKWLLGELGADTSLTDPFGRTPLHLSSACLSYARPTTNSNDIVADIMKHGGLHNMEDPPPPLMTRDGEYLHTEYLSTSDGLVDFTLDPKEEAEDTLKILLSSAGGHSLSTDKEGNLPFALSAVSRQSSLGHVFIHVQAAAAQALFG